MPNLGSKTAIYHITDISNLAGIISAGGLKSDAKLAAGAAPTVIGYAHIKERRLTKIKVPCCGGKFVGEFVPFYFCPRSPMLFVLNEGKTGRPAGCQETVLHLVSTVGAVIKDSKGWAIGDGNCGAFAAAFSNSIDALDDLDWDAIDARSWGGKSHEKSAEFLMPDCFAWKYVQKIGCYSQKIANEVAKLIAKSEHQPTIAVEPSWYY